ncbi:hypothetical protein CAEBREN_23191 [Caenorhabditis brenneri]|uniref:Uncharacterized protein n=1 Tax=Caenorhabditis brenneri TaxID=135651 RepID=G0N431_CAEBE|nr:hypothetical protein CAEBREN_23191 [Caenorhabditis brenneri]
MDCPCLVWNLLKFKKKKKQKTLDLEEEEEEEIQKPKKGKKKKPCLLGLHISLLNSLSKWMDRNIHKRTASRNTQNFVNMVECYLCWKLLKNNLGASRSKVQLY